MSNFPSLLEQFVLRSRPFGILLIGMVSGVHLDISRHIAHRLTDADNEIGNCGEQPRSWYSNTSVSTNAKKQPSHALASYERITVEFAY